ncbi:MAG: glycerol-3-phosphate 1-O-acyltransferase PlsY [Fuerstiella sp.]
MKDKSCRNDTTIAKEQSVDWVLCFVFGFLLGGIPFGYLTGRLVLKDDIRNHGSGNIGATNVGRVIGWKWGSFVLLLDACKGLLPTWLAARWATDHMAAESIVHYSVLAGIAAIVGHMYPVYLKLRGGKGVATALGVVIVLAPKALGIAFIGFVLIVATTKLVALASMVAALAFSVTYFSMAGMQAWETSNLSLTAFSILIPSLIVWRHRSNIARMISGNEPAFSKPTREDENRPAVSDSHQ